MNASKSPPRNNRPALRPAWSILMTIAGTLLRIPFPLRPPNFSMVGGMGVFGGARMPLWQALALPMLTMLLSDALLKLVFGYMGFNPWVYGSLLVYVLIGRLVVNQSRSPWLIGLASILGSTQFFLITNFGVWYAERSVAQPLYPQTASGLVACYVAGLPFLAFTLASDLGFSAILFGAHAMATAEATSTRAVQGEEMV